MAKKLWEASKDRKLNSNLYDYEKFISKKFNLKFSNNYQDILNWSIKNPGNFWSSIWDYCKIKGFKSNKKLKKSKIFYKNIFLPKSKLNFAENLLVKNNKNKAVTFISENGFREERTWLELNNNVNKIIKFFKKIKLKKNDRVAAYLPNFIETVEAFPILPYPTPTFSASPTGAVTAIPQEDSTTFVDPPVAPSAFDPPP